MIGLNKGQGHLCVYFMFSYMNIFIFIFLSERGGFELDWVFHIRDTTFLSHNTLGL